MKLSTEKQFFSNDEVKDTFYTNVRDKEHHQETRKFVEELWQIYEPYAEPKFLKKAKEDFHAKTWEMYLGCIFLKHGLNLQKNNKIEGPDIHLLLNDRSVWIEAVAPTSGTGDNAVPAYNFNEATDTPVEKVLLRLTSVIQEKFEKYNNYINNNKGIIKPEDFYVIAVNGGRIRYSLSEPSIPYIVSSVLPFGNPIITLNIKSMEITNSHYKNRDTITTAKGNPVYTNIFENEAYNGISAVLYS